MEQCPWLVFCGPLDATLIRGLLCSIGRLRCLSCNSTLAIDMFRNQVVLRVQLPHILLEVAFSFLRARVIVPFVHFIAI